MSKVLHQHFSQPFGTSGGPDRGIDSSDFLVGLLRLSAQEAVCCEGSIMAAEVEKPILGCVGGKSLCLDGLFYEFYWYLAMRMNSKSLNSVANFLAIQPYLQL